MKKTQNDAPVLVASDAQQAGIHIDVAFAVHPGCKSHSGWFSQPQEKEAFYQVLQSKRST